MSLPSILLLLPLTYMNFTDEESRSQSQANHDQNISTASTDLQKDILISVLRIFELMEETNVSQKSFMNILNFGRDLYCKGDTAMIKKWPGSWSACLALLRKNGYKEPTTYYICLNSTHPNQWSILDNSVDVCKYCNQPGTIQYHYISLTNRVQQWCSNKSFCQKMTAHWQQKDRWLYQNSKNMQTSNEIWDGQRFCEVKWFWDPQEQWLLPVRCPCCTEVISAEIIASFTDEREEQETETMFTVQINCPYCFTLFEHSPKYASGDPRNIALIGHWDGWNPFLTLASHSCGMCIYMYMYIVTNNCMFVANCYISLQGPLKYK